MRGLAVATNGILLAILTGEERIVFGHADWFLPDEKEEEERKSTSVRSSPQRERVLAEFW